MFGDVFLLERDGSPRRAERLAFGATAGRNEAWLRDTLFAHPDLLPIRDIDPSFGPLIPLCTELRTISGPLDIAFINASGRLTFVECKLWRNPEARRKVVAQALDYARSISRWTYSDLQRSVAAVSGRSGNAPFEIALERHPELIENRFVDDTARALRAGRFLLMIAGDGIREDVSGIADLINRNAASAFSFGLVEVALYGFDDGGIAVQPRIIAKTQIIERTVIIVEQSGDGGTVEVTDGNDVDGSAEFDAAAAPEDHPGRSPKQAEYRQWWAPIIGMQFDDPDQEPPRLYYPNNVRVALPWPKVWVTAYRFGDEAGVYLRDSNSPDIVPMLAAHIDAIRTELPEDTEFREPDSRRSFSIITRRPASDFADDEAMVAWLSATINAYVNTFRPRLKALAVERHRDR